MTWSSNRVDSQFEYWAELQRNNPRSYEWVEENAPQPPNWTMVEMTRLLIPQVDREIYLEGLNYQYEQWRKSQNYWKCRREAPHVADKLEKLRQANRKDLIWKLPDLGDVETNYERRVRLGDFGYYVPTVPSGQIWTDEERPFVEARWKGKIHPTWDYLSNLIIFGCSEHFWIYVPSELHRKPLLQCLKRESVRFFNDDQGLRCAQYDFLKVNSLLCTEFPSSITKQTVALPSGACSEVVRKGISVTQSVSAEKLKVGSNSVPRNRIYSEWKATS